MKLARLLVQRVVPVTASTVLLVTFLIAVLPVSALDTSAVDITACAVVTAPDYAPNAECLAYMEQVPEPLVVDAPLDGTTLASYSFWRVGPDPVPTFDAPNGNPVGEIPFGYNFVSVTDQSVEGWLQFEGGQWIQRDVATYTEASYFRGAVIQDGLEQPFAWVLDTFGLFTSAYPGGPQDADNGRLMRRYDRLNIYATVQIDNWNWYMVGPNQWVDQKFVAVARKIERPAEMTERWVAVDLFEQTLVAYDGDTPVFATLISSGVPPFDTNEGIFDVWARVARDGMSGATGAPEAYALQSIPWVQYFDGGISLHGTYWHDLFGYRHSHGCVNLTISDARWVYEFFDKSPSLTEEGEIPNAVYVHSTGEYRAIA